MGELDEGGYLKVTDRKKELLVTSGGKKTGPAVLESRLKQLPAVAQVVVVGDGRNYLAALFTLDPLRVAAAAAEAGSPARDVVQARRPVPSSGRTWSAPSNRPTGSSRASRPSSASPCSRRSSRVGGGELTPTLKLKRRVIYEKYAAEIERLYG